MPAAPFRLRVQRPDGSPVDGAAVDVALIAAPFQALADGSTVKLQAVRLTTDAAGLAVGDLVTGRYHVRVEFLPAVQIEHDGGGVPPLVPPVVVAGLRRRPDGSPSEAPLTLRPERPQMVGRTVVTVDPVTVQPVAGLVSVALVPGRYVAGEPGGLRGLVQVPGDWLAEVLGAPALWGGSEATWGGAPATWGTAA